MTLHFTLEAWEEYQYWQMMRRVRTVRSELALLEPVESGDDQRSVLLQRKRWLRQSRNPESDRLRPCESA